MANPAVKKCYVPFNKCVSDFECTDDMTPEQCTSKVDYCIFAANQCLPDDSYGCGIFTDIDAKTQNVCVGDAAVQNCQKGFNSCMTGVRCEEKMFPYKCLE